MAIGSFVLTHDRLEKNNTVLNKTFNIDPASGIMFVISRMCLTMVLSAYWAHACLGHHSMDNCTKQTSESQQAASEKEMHLHSFEC